MARYIFANDENGKKISIADAKQGQKYYCRVCGSRLIPKKGEVNEHHFAHENKEDCDSWYENKGEWHRRMQNLFPEEYQEVTLMAYGEKHVADVSFMKENGQRLVIEFQHSPMSHEEFVRRTRFWKANNTDLIWVFDLRGREMIRLKTQDDVYRWKRHAHTFGDHMIESTPIIFYTDVINQVRAYGPFYLYPAPPVFYCLSGIGYPLVNVEMLKSDDKYDYDVTPKNNSYGLVQLRRISKQYTKPEIGFMEFIKERKECYCKEEFIEYSKRYTIYVKDKDELEKLRKFITGSYSDDRVADFFLSDPNVSYKSGDSVMYKMIGDPEASYECFCGCDFPWTATIIKAMQNILGEERCDVEYRKRERLPQSDEAGGCNKTGEMYNDLAKEKDMFTEDEVYDLLQKKLSLDDRVAFQWQNKIFSGLYDEKIMKLFFAFLRGEDISAFCVDGIYYRDIEEWYPEYNPLEILDLMSHELARRKNQSKSGRKGTTTIITKKGEIEYGY